MARSGIVARLAPPSKRPRENGLVRRGLEVGVEGHREVAKEDPAHGRGPYVRLRQLDEAVRLARAEALESRRKRLVELDTELPLDLALDDEPVAEQVLDDASPQPVVLRKAESAERRRAPLRDGGLPEREL